MRPCFMHRPVRRKHIDYTAHGRTAYREEAFLYDCAFLRKEIIGRSVNFNI